jgi:hypothetical protein
MTMSIKPSSSRPSLLWRHIRASDYLTVNETASFTGLITTARYPTPFSIAPKSSWTCPTPSSSSTPTRYQKRETSRSTTFHGHTVAVILVTPPRRAGERTVKPGGNLSLLNDHESDDALGFKRSDWQSVHVIDTVTKQPLPDLIEHSKFTFHLEWLADEVGSLFMPDAEHRYNETNETGISLQATSS